MSLVQEYLALVSDVVSAQEYDKKSISVHNQKVTKMRSIAKEIETKHPGLKREFCELLSHNDKTIRLWVAHHILEVMNCERAYRKAALKEIRSFARRDESANGFGQKVWLKEWYKQHPKDRWL